MASASRRGASAAHGTIADFLRDGRLFHQAEAASQRAQLALYRLVAEGEAVAVARLVGTVGLSGQEVQKILGSIPPSNFQHDEGGRVVGFRGLSQVPSRHRLTLEGRTLYAWCAFDCLFLPGLLECPIGVTSICPVTQAEIRLTVTPTGVRDVAPDGVVMTFVTPEAARVRDDLRGTFCCHVNFFASEPAAETWRAENEGALIVSLDEGFEFGRIRNEMGFKDALAG